MKFGIHFSDPVSKYNQNHWMKKLEHKNQNAPLERISPHYDSPKVQFFGRTFYF